MKQDHYDFSASAPRTPEATAPKPPSVKRPQLTAAASGLSAASSSPSAALRDDSEGFSSPLEVDATRRLRVPSLEGDFVDLVPLDLVLPLEGGEVDSSTSLL